MEIFYEGWSIVQQFINADAHVPKEVYLPRNALRQVALYLAERREFPVMEVLEALKAPSQPELIKTESQAAQLVSRRETNPAVETGAVVTPMAHMD